MTKLMRRRDSWVLLLSIIAMVIGLVSGGFSAFVYLNTPKQITSYVQTHQKELKGPKGAKGDTGPPGLTGLRGTSGQDGQSGSSSPTYCNTYSYTYNSSSTTCF